MKIVWKISLLSLLVFMLTVVTVLAGDSILCASTTSTQNSGLFDHILPLFAERTGIEVKVIAVGTGAALEIGKRGDVDVVLVHAKDDELKMVREKWFVDRHDLMYNDFIIMGPPTDPAGLHGMKEAMGGVMGGVKSPFFRFSRKLKICTFIRL